MSPVRFIRILLFSFLTGCAHYLYAQPQDFIFDHISVEDGLSQSTVFSIAQDRSGFMWFATREGLNRYDSRQIEVYRHDPSSSTSLPDNTIYSLLTDRKGRLWVGTRNGLSLYDPLKDEFRNYFTLEHNTRLLSNNTITCIFEDSHRNIWVGTRNGLNLIVERDSIEFIRFKHDEQNRNSLVNNDVRCVFEDSQGTLWIGTSQGFSKLVYRNQQEFMFTSFDATGADAFREKTNWVNTIAEDANGNLLIGTEKDGLKLFDRQKGKFIPRQWKEEGRLESKAIRTILKDLQGNFWIGTIGGLFIIETQTGQVRKFGNVPDSPYSISDNSVRSVFMDRDGSFWIGTFHGGVNMYSPLSKQFQHIKPGLDWPRLRFKIASALHADTKGNVWIGTEGNGLLCVDRKNNSTRHFKHDDKDPNSLSHDNIKCLLPDGDKGLWIGTIKGLNFYDFRKDRFYHYTLRANDDQIISDDAIYGLTKDHDGNIWVATYRAGLARFNPVKNSFEETYSYDPADSLSLSADGVTTVFIDSRQDLWVGTISGLNKKERGGRNFTRFMHRPKDSTSISGQYIHCVYEDSHGRLWVGTRGDGLNMMTGDERSFRRFGMRHGLPGNSVYGILEDNSGYLWLSTENGLSRFDPSSFTCKNFTKEDGLVCNEFNFNSYYKDPSGHMYFGGYNGVVSFSPERIKRNGVVPALAFTRLKLFNQEVKARADEEAVLQQRLTYTKQLEFRYDQNVFSIEFAVLNFINAPKNQFAYRLEGFEERWNHVEEPVATYMNLAPGRYTLLVKGANNDGVWNESPLAMTIDILPPPWKTWWAYSIYLAVFLSLLYAWSRFNKKQVQLEHDLQLEHLEKQKQEELHQAKLNFFTNIAHEIRTPLTLMNGPVDQLSERLQHDAYLKKEIGLVKSNADRLLRLLNQLLDFQRQETGNVRLKVRRENFVDFIREIQVPFQEFAESRKISLHLHTQETGIPLWFDRDELSKVFYNLLVNALKFTPGGGKVLIGIAKEEQPGNAAEESYKVRITIEDNGLGISSEQLEKIFHRFYQAENTGVQEAGFGIGLALAKGIIDLHHGTITVESREATHDVHGFTRFTILLQGGHAHFAEDQLCHGETLAETTSSVPGTDAEHSEEDDNASSPNKHLILVVEDNDEIRSYLVDLLRQHHYEVAESRNGQEGCEMAAERLPDLILSDVMMSVMNGLDLVARIKGDVRTSHIPVILLTARASLNHQVEGLVTGADDYITKPFNNQLLLIKIRNHLSLREKLKEKYSRIVSLQPQQEEVEDPDDKFLRKLMGVLEANLLDPEFNVTRLVREIGMSRPVLFRKIKMLTGLSVIDLIRSVRLKKAEMLLKQGKLSISEVAFAVGFSDPKYFSKLFKDQYGKSPSQYMEA